MTPARLHRKEEKKSSFCQLMDILGEWALTHSLLCLFILMSILIAVFVVLIFTLVGVSATESGTVYNQFSNII